MEFTANQILFTRMIRLKMSQEAFARSLGYSRSYIKDIESGRVKPSRAFLEALTSKYGLSVDSILGNFCKQIQAAFNTSYLNFERGFVYLYDFTDKGLEIAEEILLKCFSDAGKTYKILDGRRIKGQREFWNELLDLKKNGESFYRMPDADKIKQCTKNLDFVVLKGFSEFPLKHRVCDIYIAIYYCIEGHLIVIDKPSWLEKNIRRFYHRAYPIHVRNEFGFTNPPE